MNRRAVLAGGAATAALAAIGAVVRRMGYPEPGPADLAALRPILDALPPHVAEAGDVAWDSERVTVDRIAVAAALLADWRGEELAPWLVDRVHADYSAGRVRRIAGWLLAETEIRLCELAAHKP